MWLSNRLSKMMVHVQILKYQSGWAMWHRSVFKKFLTDACAEKLVLYSEDMGHCYDFNHC